ncbi:MAG: ATP-binding protein [Luteolibacter sp.]
MAEAEMPMRKDEAWLRRSFRESEQALAVENARRAALLAAIFMLAGSTLDLVVHPEKAYKFFLIRLVSTILLSGIFLQLSARFRSKSSDSRISLGIAVIPLFAICYMIHDTGGGNSTYYAGLSLILFGLSLLLRWTFLSSLRMTIFCFICYAATILFSKNAADFHLVFNNSYFLFVTSVFVIAGSYFYENLRFREYVLKTEVEHSRELLEIQNRQLSELDEAKTRFFANISHELRTPLTIMLGITERLKSILSRQSNDPMLHEMTGMLEQNGLRLLKLIDDLLDLVRFDTGHADINRQPTHLEAHVEGLLKSLRHLAEQDHVALLWETKTDVQNILLDRDRFDKILLNLVINAIKFTPSSGSIEVKLAHADNKLVFSVEDTGVGIPPEVLPRIFERFWQVDTSSTRKFQGAGIGLALVRSLTEAMGGNVNVESSIGYGTKFTVILPAEVAADLIALPSVNPEDPLENGGKIADLHRKAAMSIPGKIQPPPPASPIVRGPAAMPYIGTRPSTARPLVLIADDEPDIRRFLRMQIEDVDVIEASDGAEALELCRLQHPQLALLDHMMPEMDGVEVCRRIRENHSTRGTAVIILTARADERTKLSALEAGANDFLTKPFSTAELGLRLHNQIVMARIRREMVDLNAELNSALEQIKENEVLMVRNEKLSALGRMSAGIIHEINNPLNYASVGLHALATFTRQLPQNDQADYEDVLKDIKEGVDRVAQIILDLRQFTRESSSLNADTDLAEVLSRSRRMISHQIGKEIAFNLTSPNNALISGNGNQLVQVFINLFQNSIDAIHMRIAESGGPAGKIDVALDPAGAGWQVIIRDNGIGIPPENIQKIFDPFFTSKDVGKGMGLGLSITHQILQNHKAVVNVDSRPGEYTRFSITFPAVSYDSDAEPNLAESA